MPRQRFSSSRIVIVLVMLVGCRAEPARTRVHLPQLVKHAEKRCWWSTSLGAVEWPHVEQLAIAAEHGTAVVAGDTWRGRVHLARFSGSASSAVSRATSSRIDQTLELPPTLLALRMTERRIFAVTRTACETEAGGRRCVLIRAIERDSGRSKSATLILPAPARSWRVAVESETLWLARSYAERAPEITRISIREPAGDLESETFEMGGQYDAGLSTELLGLAARAEDWAVVWRAGPVEDARSRIFLSTKESSVELSELGEVLVIEWLGWLGDSIVWIAAYEFDRPLLWRYRTIERGLEGPIRLDNTGDSGLPNALLAWLGPPESVGPRRSAVVLGAESVEIRTLAGDPWARVALPERVTSAELAATDDHFVIAFARDEADSTRVEVRALRCAP